MAGVILKGRKSTNWIQKKSGETYIIRNIRENKYRWEEHVARRWKTGVIEWIPREHERPRSRLRTR